MQGTRRDLQDDTIFPMPGEYGKGHDGKWYGCPPVNVDANGFPLTANLSRHDVEEHSDGTISVYPSILVRQNTEREWHGYLRRGIWSEA